MDESIAVNTPAPTATSTATGGLHTTVAVRHYLSSEYLWTTLDSSRRSRMLEEKLVGTTPWAIEHRSAVIVTVQSAVAFLEALVNEIYVDAGDRGGGTGRAAMLNPRCRSLLASYWEASNDGRGSVLDKFRMALLFADAKPIGKGGRLHQNIALLIQLRNALIHFGPDWHESGSEVKLGKKLATAGFAPSTLLPSGTGGPWFPLKAISAGCAEWAYTTCTDFAEEWLNRMGLPLIHRTDLAAFEKEVASRPS